MPYFRPEFIDFFAALGANNSRQWFDAHRKQYEEFVREPFKKLVGDLLIGLKDIDPDIDMGVKDALFRINRDSRNHTQTASYHTHIAAGFSKGGRKSAYAGYFIHFSHKHAFIGGGAPFLEKESLKKIRIEIASRAPEFHDIVNAEAFKRTFTHILGENTSDVPGVLNSMYAKHPIIGNKQFYYGAMYSADTVLFREDLRDFVIDHFRKGQPVNEFLKSALDTIRYKGFTLSA
jgi:uncharacterized protein (TIGR02453 family)